MEEALLPAYGTCSFCTLPLRHPLTMPVAAEFSVGDDFQLVAGLLRDIELCYGDIRNDPQKISVWALDKSVEISLLDFDLFGSSLRQSGK